MSDHGSVPVALPAATVRSGVIQLVAQAIQLALYITAAVVLARLLTPADFGLFAMVASLTAFVASFKDFGFTMAVVHRETVDDQQNSALFWMSMKLNLLTGIFVAAMAPVLAWFYGEPQLTAMTLAVAVGVVLIGLTAQHESLLIRRMQFAGLAAVDVASLLAGVALGITFAILGAGYWSLVVQFVATGVLRSAGVWAVSGWRPARQTRGARALVNVDPMLSYAGYLTAYRILNHVGRNLDRVLVGYFSGATAVGFYDNAFRWSLYPVQQVYQPLMSVAVASLSRVQHAPATYRAFCRAAFLPMFSIVLPALVFMAVEPRRLLLVLLGEQWLPAVPLFQLLCLAALASSMIKITKWIYLSVGETKRQFRWGLVYTPVMIAAVAAGVPWGAYGVAVGFTAGTCLLTWPSLAYCFRRSPLTIRDFAGIVARPALAAAGAGLVLLAADRIYLPDGDLVVSLLLRLAIFLLAYAALWIGMPGGGPAAAEIRNLVLTLRPQAVQSLHVRPGEEAADHARP